MIRAASSKIASIRPSARVCSPLVLKYRSLATASTTSPSPSTTANGGHDHSLLGTATPDSKKINKLVDEIANLSLLDASSLVEALKIRLNIKDMVMAQPAASTATSPTTAAEPVEAVEEKKEQTEFKISLESFDAASKAKVIREMKGILPGANLVEAKKFVESAPKTILENISKEQMEKIKNALEAVGAKVKVE